ncbi:PGN_0703 family putative restriction endonuclease [Aureimonas psammosilenae]|uniref:PGN_0703 family putative restriction endonuclease n=1 Tax=Aureimonas psammosilenae TaxID=2495496 RepID=UPI0012611B18|nr:hypothetical protein [Aureimonas psammosilenae]
MAIANASNLQSMNEPEIAVAPMKGTGEFGRTDRSHRLDQPFQRDGAERQRPGEDLVRSILDPANLASLPAIPLVPETILKKHHCFVATDDRFKATARMLQSLWRTDRGMAACSYRDGNGRHRKLGSRINAADGRAGGNFLNSRIARLVARELVYSEVGAVIERGRLFTNLLSSQPLCFNLFGSLKLDLSLATAVFAELLPGFIDEVLDVRFESSPARGHAAFSGDGTAFDILVLGRTSAGRRAFIAVEVKYTETARESLPRFTGRKRFDEIARTSNLFLDPSDPQLYANPVQQLFRQSCLAASMLQNEIFDTGFHLLVAPGGNQLALNAGAAFKDHLRDPDAGPLPFRTITLERLIEAMAAVGAPELARALHRRYCDFWLVHGQLELHELSVFDSDDACALNATADVAPAGKDPQFA